ncbi:unnamed protein product [Auanema sp. JU1783]|nr:unnamed protein product [Auanema sp. JU1783]
MQLLLFLSLCLLTYQQTNNNAGIFFRLNQRAIDYITDLSSDALPQLLNNLSPPDVELSAAKIYNTLIHEVTRPNISSKFIEGKGIRANILLPYIRVSSHARISFLFFEYDGAFLVDIHNLTIGIEIHYKRNETIDRNVIEAPYCEVKHSDVQLIIDQDSQLNSLRVEIRDAIVNALKDTVCETSINALRYIDEQEIQDSPTNITMSSEVVEEDDDSLSIVELGASLCHTESMTKEEKEEEKEEERDIVETTAFSNKSAEKWSADLRLVYPPRFTKDDLIFGFDGGSLLNGKEAKDVSKPNTLDVKVLNEKMVGILVSEYIPNTILSHLYDNRFGSVHKRFVAADLPKALRKLGTVFCAKCYLDINITLTSKPKVEINEKLGARILISGNVTFNFQGRKENTNLLHSNVSLHVTVKPTIRHSRIYGDVSLTSVDVNVFEMALGGVLATPLEKVTSFIIPRILWPEFKKRIRFALNKRGIQLPVFCGVELEHLSLSYVNHAVFLNTDFRFNLPLFIERFKIYLSYKSQFNSNLPRYLH